jgi:hypothetical protein
MTLLLGPYRHGPQQAAIASCTEQVEISSVMHSAHRAIMEYVVHSECNVGAEVNPLVMRSITESYNMPLTYQNSVTRRHVLNVSQPPLTH